MSASYEIEIAPTGYQSLKAVKNKKTQREITKIIDGLDRSPEKRGKPLVGSLEGLRSANAARNRYRILYRSDPGKKVVSVLLVGERKPGAEADLYALAQKLLMTLMGKEGI